jgi:hypothetical protein
MGMITEREIGRFYAEGDMGNRYTVVQRQDMIVFRPLTGPVRRIPGKIRYSLVTGEQLDDRADGSLVIMNSDTVIRRVEPCQRDRESSLINSSGKHVAEDRLDADQGRGQLKG